MRFPFSLSHCFLRPFSSFQPPGFHFLPNFCFSLLWFFFCVYAFDYRYHMENELLWFSQK